MKTLLIIVLVAALAYMLGFPGMLHALKSLALGCSWLLNVLAGVIRHALA